MAAVCETTIAASKADKRSRADLRRKFNQNPNHEEIIQLIKKYRAIADREGLSSITFRPKHGGVYVEGPHGKCLGGPHSSKHMDPGQELPPREEMVPIPGVPGALGYNPVDVVHYFRMDTLFQEQLGGYLTLRGWKVNISHRHPNFRDQVTEFTIRF